MTNQKTPEQGGATEEQIEAAARAMFEHPDEPGSYTWAEMAVADPSRADIWREDARRIVNAAFSASASAHPADEHHDADEREAECKCSAYSEDRGGGYFELMVEPDPDCPEHGAGIRAVSEDHAATVTGDREKLIAEARAVFEAAGRMPQGTMDHQSQWLPFARLCDVTERMIDALAAPVEVDAEALREARAETWDEAIAAVHAWWSLPPERRPAVIINPYGVGLRGEGR